MPHIKPKTCHKCGQMYTGWRCPRCYRKAHGAGRSSGRGSKRTFSASSVLRPAYAAPIVAHDTDDDTSERYGDPRICTHCGYLTTTKVCTYCGKE